MTFGKLLKDLRTKKGKSIKTLGQELGLNYTYISKLENSKVNPSIKSVEKFSRYFKYNSEELLVSAGKIPRDIEEILKDHPKEAIDYLRRKFSGRRNNRS
ncbi:MAG: helix-turn-helix transcriptional regulator [Thermodesulfobacteriota bacterium]|jgi:transcriptional regulator with XRE-family HTH domain